MLTPHIFGAVYSTSAVSVYSFSLVRFWPGENNLNATDCFLGKEPRKLHHGLLTTSDWNPICFCLLHHKISTHVRFSNELTSPCEFQIVFGLLGIDSNLQEPNRKKTKPIKVSPVVYRPTKNCFISTVTLAWMPDELSPAHNIFGREVRSGIAPLGKNYAGAEADRTNQIVQGGLYTMMDR